LSKTNLSSISLFTGAGGLDLGLEAAGFNVRLCVEIDADAKRTLSINKPNWKIAEPSDIHQLRPIELLRQSSQKIRATNLLAGGPPCQPFSKSSYWVTGDSGRLNDPRAKTLKAYLRVLETLLPRVFLLENVKGLAYEGKDEGIRLLCRGVARINHRHKTNYKIHQIHINAADYGVPQFRERIIIVASRDGKPFVMPAPTHGDQNTNLEAYTTAWDAIGHLDKAGWSTDLTPTGKWAKLLPSIPEGQNYLWHTARSGGIPLFGWRTRYWSFLLKLAKNRPSWTILAAPGPAVGPFHWKSRLLTARELAKLQTFPANYRFFGTRRSVQRQIGNAVPCLLGEILGREIRRQFFNDRISSRLKFTIPHRVDCPARERIKPVPAIYRELRGIYPDHPGEGLGPGTQNRYIVDAINQT
jgi:DNA (cytosine-5)-methyltransferase 1